MFRPWSISIKFKPVSFTYNFNAPLKQKTVDLFTILPSVKGAQCDTASLQIRHCRAHDHCKGDWIVVTSGKCDLVYSVRNTNRTQGTLIIKVTVPNLAQSASLNDLYSQNQ